MTFLETLVARVTGIPKQRVAQTRKTALLIKGTDWDVENSCVVYTHDGLKKICVALGVDAAALQWPAADALDSRPCDADLEKTEGSAATPQPPAFAIAPPIPDVAIPLPAPELIPQFPPGAPPATNPPHVELENQLAAATVAAVVEHQTKATAAAALIEIIVVKSAPNPRIVYGKIIVTGPAAASTAPRPVIVGVRDNRNFIPGMKLKAHHAAGDYYRMFGNCPRWPGRW